MEGLVIGRIVYLVLSAAMVEQITRRRQEHVGNRVFEEQVVPAMVVKVWDEETGRVNLKAMLDGSDEFWATSVLHDAGSEVRDGANPDRPGFRVYTSGTWHWMYQGQATRGNAK